MNRMAARVQDTDFLYPPSPSNIQRASRHYGIRLPHLGVLLMRAECLPITPIPHATDLFKDYLLHFDKVRDFFPAPPFDPATISDSAKTLDYPADRRTAVAAILEKQNKNWGAGP